MNKYLKVFPIVLLLISSSFYLWQTSVIKDQSLLDTFLEVVNDLLSRSTFTIYLAVLVIVTFAVVAVLLSRHMYGVEITEELKKRDRPLSPILQAIAPFLLLGAVVVFALWATRNYGLL